MFVKLPLTTDESTRTIIINTNHIISIGEYQVKGRIMSDVTRVDMPNRTVYISLSLDEVFKAITEAK